ncbi:MAG: nuclear transport factor 2 family protein [Parvularcula sp.]|jgi:hypothetical protein|nr:nuclear transport factor 2 family protein [Parvularcula sp.]
MRQFNLIIAAAVIAVLPAAATAQADISPASVAVDANPQERIDAIERHIDAYRSGDLDAFVDTFTPDAIVRADGFVAIGREQIKRLYELNFAPGAPALKVHGKGIEGDVVTVSHGYILADGQELCCAVSEYKIVDGRVSFIETRG